MTDALLRYDAAARKVAGLPRAEYRKRFLRAEGPERWALQRMRWRWRLDEFASQAMAPILSRASVVSPPGELDDAFYAVEPLRVGHRESFQHLIMTGRGIGKTTRQKVRCFHGLAYGARRVSLAIGQSDGDATGWIAALRDWCENPSPELALVFPELACSGNEHHLTISTRFGKGALLARGWRSSMRGINVLSARPDALDLDDVESEDNSISEGARNANQQRLLGKVLPLVPLEGGAEIWWVQTPVHHDAVAIRAWRRDDAMRGWDTRRLPVIRRWPDRTDLWDEARRIYFDVDTHGDLKASKAAARAWYLDRQEAMDEGAEVLDPVRMGVWACHAKRWDIGEVAWAREYEMRATPAGAGVLQPDTWPRFKPSGRSVLYAGREIPLSSMAWKAHYDPSDGGDDGALVAVGALQGRYFSAVNKVWQHSRLSVQIAELPETLRPLYYEGLRELQWEPTSGSASIVREQIERAFRQAGMDITLTDRPSTEPKVSRIVGTLEPVGASGRLTLPVDIPTRLISQGTDFNPARSDNADDWLDALQRCVEAHEAPEGSLSASDWSGIASGMLG